MAYTRQSATYHVEDLGEITTMNHHLVRDRIDELLREGEALRAERQAIDRRSLAGRPVVRRGGILQAARVRLGHWLVGLGWTVAGCPGGPGGQVQSVDSARMA